jgi:hypothetical protein
MTFRLVTHGEFIGETRLVDVDHESRPILYKKHDYIQHSLTPYMPENLNAREHLMKYINFERRIRTRGGEGIYRIGFLRSNNRERATLIVEIPTHHYHESAFLVLPTYRDPQDLFSFWFEYSGDFKRTFFPDRMDKIEIMIEKLRDEILKFDVKIDLFEKRLTDLENGYTWN